MFCANFELLPVIMYYFPIQGVLHNLIFEEKEQKRKKEAVKEGRTALIFVF